MTLKEGNKLLVAEILRRILKPTREEDGTWRIRKNLEIADMVNVANIMGDQISPT